MQNDNTDSEIKIVKFDKNTIYTEHPDADAFTGIKLKPKDDLTSSYMALAQKIGMEVIKGNFDLLMVIPPAVCLAEISLLEKLAKYNNIFCKYIHEATKLPVDSQENAFKRVRLLCSGLIANCFLADKYTESKQLIPNFKNEYLEGTMKDGAYFFAHTKSRGPNLNHIRIVGPNKSYIFEETEQLTTKVKSGNVNHVTAIQKGKINIKFEDGSEFECQRPSFEI